MYYRSRGGKCDGGFTRENMQAKWEEKLRRMCGENGDGRGG
jgi:hypothetical protein